MPSEEELAARGGDFKLLPEDEYVLEVKSIDIKENQRNPYNGEVRDTLMVKFRPIKFADGSPVVDVDGEDIPEDKWVIGFIDPTKVGMKPQPSKARKFFTSCLGLPVGSGFSIDDYQELVGSRLLGTIVLKAAYADKPERNDITSYRAIPKRPTRRKVEPEPDEDDGVEDAISEAVGKARKPALPGEKKSSTKAKVVEDDTEGDDW